MELASLASSTLNPKEVLYLIVKKISEIIRVTRCSMISINAMNNRYADVISSFEDPKITNLRLDLKKYPEIRRALSLKKMVVVKDAQKDPLMKEVKDIIAPLGIRSIVVIPVIFRDEVIGTLLLRTSRKSYTFTKREIKLLIALANASANALYNAFLYERLDKEKTKLEKLAITDYLTGNTISDTFITGLRRNSAGPTGTPYLSAVSCSILTISNGSMTAMVTGLETLSLGSLHSSLGGIRGDPISLHGMEARSSYCSFPRLL